MRCERFGAPILQTGVYCGDQTTTHVLLLTLAERENKMPNDKILIVVNGSENPVESATVTYEQVVKLAYPNAKLSDPNMTYSVSFEHAKNPTQGTLSKNGSVEVKPRNTEFDVVEANRS